MGPDAVPGTGAIPHRVHLGAACGGWEGDSPDLLWPRR